MFTAFKFLYSNIEWHNVITKTSERITKAELFRLHSYRLGQHIADWQLPSHCSRVNRLDNIECFRAKLLTSEENSKTVFVSRHECPDMLVLVVEGDIRFFTNESYDSG